MNKDLSVLSKIIINQLERLDDLDLNNQNAQLEIGRAVAISQNATSYIKTINTGLKILELGKKYNIKEKTICQAIGISHEE